MTFTRSALLLAALIGVASPSIAADMPVKAAPVAPAVIDWTGFYAGLHSGWTWTDGPTNNAFSTLFGFPRLASGHDLNTSGVTFGAHAGYNWQVTPRSWVVGIEGDITGVGLKETSAGTPACPPGPLCGAGVAVPTAVQAMQRDINWLASVRGRLGYTLDQGVWGWFAPGMVYATGGAAWANVDYTVNTGDGLLLCGGPSCAWPASFSTTKTGWTVGGGYESVLGGNWLVRLEYLYYHFGGNDSAFGVGPVALCGGACATTYTFGELNIHTVRGGLSYKFGAPVASGGAYAPAPLSAAGWTGFYLGSHAGWAWTSGDTQSAVTTVPGFTALTFSPPGTNTDGALKGTHLGYNWQFNPSWLVGVEGDFTSANLKSTSMTTGLCPALFCGVATPINGALAVMQRDVNWLASVRARLGYTWAASMLYVTGGVAWADVDYTATAGSSGIACGGLGCAYSVTASTTKSGWAAGGGYETVLVGKWLARLEYLYYRFDGDTIAASGAPAANCAFASCTTTYTFSDLNIHTVRAGLTYKF